MSKASDKLEAETDGDVPTADEVIAATGAEASEVVQRKKDLDANRQHRLQQGKVSGEYEKPRQA